MAYEVTEQQEVEQLREALAAGRLLAYTQPILDHRRGIVVQEEVLARMAGDDDESVRPPSAFIPQAERSGLIKEIDLAMAIEALRLIEDGREADVNVSAASIDDPDFSAAIVELLEGSPGAADAMTFELTETAVLERMDAAGEFAERLSSLGCRFALDDFGTGFASLTYLRQLPIDFLKIDISFVRQAVGEFRDESMIRGIVAMARQLGIVTVAEGVEDQATFEKIVDCGVDRIQGHLVGRPQPVDAPPFERLRSRRRAFGDA